MLHRNVRGIVLCFLTLFLFLSGCGSLKDDTLLIVNAVITEVDTEKQTITVKDDVDENPLGEDCLVDCSSIPMFYCDFAALPCNLQHCLFPFPDLRPKHSEGCDFQILLNKA